MLVGGRVNKKEFKISNEMDLNIFMLIIVINPSNTKFKNK